jgi:hypothetical protein
MDAVRQYSKCIHIISVIAEKQQSIVCLAPSKAPDYTIEPLKQQKRGCDPKQATRSTRATNNNSRNSAVMECIIIGKGSPASNRNGRRQTLQMRMGMDGPHPVFSVIVEYFELSLALTFDKVHRACLQGVFSCHGRLSRRDARRL